MPAELIERCIKNSKALGLSVTDSWDCRASKDSNDGGDARLIEQCHRWESLAFNGTHQDMAALEGHLNLPSLRHLSVSRPMFEPLPKLFDSGCLNTKSHNKGRRGIDLHFYKSWQMPSLVSLEMWNLIPHPFEACNRLVELSIRFQYNSFTALNHEGLSAFLSRCTSLKRLSFTLMNMRGICVPDTSAQHIHVDLPHVQALSLDIRRGTTPDSAIQLLSLFGLPHVKTVAIKAYPDLNGKAAVYSLLDELSQCLPPISESVPSRAIDVNISIYEQVPHCWSSFLNKWSSSPHIESLTIKAPSIEFDTEEFVDWNPASLRRLRLVDCTKATLGFLKWLKAEISDDEDAGPADFTLEIVRCSMLDQESVEEILPGIAINYED